MRLGPDVLLLGCETIGSVCCASARVDMVGARGWLSCVQMADQNGQASNLSGTEVVNGGGPNSQLWRFYVRNRRTQILALRASAAGCGTGSTLALLNHCRVSDQRHCAEASRRAPALLDTCPTVTELSPQFLLLENYKDLKVRSESFAPARTDQNDWFRFRSKQSLFIWRYSFVRSFIHSLTH